MPASRAVDMGRTEAGDDLRVSQPKGLDEALERLSRQRPPDPAAVRLLGNSKVLARRRVDAPAIAMKPRLNSEDADHYGRDALHRIAVARDEGVEIDEMSDPVGDTVDRSRDHHSAVAVSHEHYVREALALNQSAHVSNVCAQAHVRGEEVRTLSEPRERRREHAMPGGLEKRREFLPAPRTMPRAMDKAHMCSCATSISLRSGGDTMGWADFGLDLAALWGRHRRRADSRRFSL